MNIGYTNSVVGSVKFSGNQVDAGDILKAKKKREKAAKKAFQQSDDGLKEKTGKKARNRFLLKSYGKTLWTVPVSVAATFLSGGALWWTIPVAAGGNVGRAALGGVNYAVTENNEQKRNSYTKHKEAYNAFSKAKVVRRSIEAEFDELKALAQAEKAKKENDDENQVDFTHQDDY